MPLPFTVTSNEQTAPLLNPPSFQVIPYYAGDILDFAVRQIRVHRKAEYPLAQLLADGEIRTVGEILAAGVDRLPVQRRLIIYG